MNIRKALLTKCAAAALLAISGGFAGAADFAEPVPEWSWSGFYLGAHVGYGELDLQGDWCPSECEFSFDDMNLNGGLGGAQAGFNWQSDSIVFGVEADITFPAWADSQGNCDGDCTSNADASIDLLASLRGRLGIAFDRSLVYVTGGGAYVDGEVNGWCAEECGDQSLSDFGWVIGAGWEQAVGDDVSLRVEGLYYSFDADHSIEDWNEASDGDEVGVDDAWVVRVGINWLIH